MIFFCPTWPSFCHSSSFGITTASNCMMIDAVMYGMIPSEKIATLVIAPPENRFSRATGPPCFAESSSALIWLKSTYGQGMCDPSRKTAIISIVKRTLLRRSATRMMLTSFESIGGQATG